METRVISGIHAVRHALEAEPAPAELLIEKGRRHPRINELVHLARRRGVPVSFVPRAALDRLSGGARHQGAVAREASDPARARPDFGTWLEGLDPDRPQLVLLLDRVTDPHNLGACVRTAEAAGAAGVVVPRAGSADPDSPVVAKSACGALSRLPLLTVPNLGRAMERMKARDFWLVGLAGEAEPSLFEVDLKGRVGLVMGGEGRGLRRLVREGCDRLVRIPMSGAVESLNVSVATGVALFEAVRQRRDSAS